MNQYSPEWYQHQIDDFISTAEELFHQNQILQSGYSLSDADGSRNSAFRNEAVLNNTFSEKDVRDTLSEIKNHTTHQLVARNHDNVHFWQWSGHMDDFIIDQISETATMTIDAETFLDSNHRDAFKLSQFYRRWISINDLLNESDVFDWHLLLFINQKIASDYELRIDDRDIIIRFKISPYWKKFNYPVYLYKFDTRVSTRRYISRELVENQWDWKMPITYLENGQFFNTERIILAFNKIADPDIRTDGLTHIDTLGDNLEFLMVKNGYVDLRQISNFNKQYILSETDQWLWMSAFVPKFLHEYPIILPIDHIYRPYTMNLQPVYVDHNGLMQEVKAIDGEAKTIYIDTKGELNKEDNSGWDSLIRPIVLSDAFDNPVGDPYQSFEQDLNTLRDLTVSCADLIEKFKFALPNMLDNALDQYLDWVEDSIFSVREAHNAFLKKRQIEFNREYEEQYLHMLDVINDVRGERKESKWFHPKKNHDSTFWTEVSPLIHIARELADKYYSSMIISEMGSQRDLWEYPQEFNGSIRFQRPIDVMDFWTFEYDYEKKVWRPYPLQLERHFPDVYLLKDPNKREDNNTRIFKAMFFYSDTQNVNKELTPIVRPSADWENDSNTFTLHPAATYRDIFMEKFYWMGVRSIYKGVLASQNRWEVVEYVLGNDNYQRFNDLFIDTMDPYFKLGLASYLISDHYNFPFDDAVDKMNEAISKEFLGYKRVTNFEMYLDRNWVPQYFDYLTRIMDSFQYKDLLIRRPRASFNIERLLPFMIYLQGETYGSITEFRQEFDRIYELLKKDNYKLNLDIFADIDVELNHLHSNMKELLEFTSGLDLQIYDIEDINHIISLYENHFKIIAKLEALFDQLRENIEVNNHHRKKKEIIDAIINILIELPDRVDSIRTTTVNFNMNDIMAVLNDLTGYFNYPKQNDNDRSLVGYINEFNNPWSTAVKEARDRVFVSSATLFGSYNKDRYYTDDEIRSFGYFLNRTKESIRALNDAVKAFYQNFNYDVDQTVLDKIEYCQMLLDRMEITVQTYDGARDKLVAMIQNIEIHLYNMEQFATDQEKEFMAQLQDALHNLLNCLSYLDNEHDLEDVEKYKDEINDIIERWNAYNTTEAEVFEKLEEITISPVKFLNQLIKDKELFDAIMDYLRSVDREYIPDLALPTYSDVYSINEVELVSGGFKNEIGEIVYVPNVGVYSIDDITGNVGTVSSITQLGYLSTTFRNPCAQQNPYDSITTGAGMGISIKANTYHHKIIIDNEVAEMVLLRIKTALNLIQQTVESDNSYHNNRTRNHLDTFTNIKEEWIRILERYQDYVSFEMREFIIELFEDLQKVYSSGYSFINSREPSDSIMKQLLDTLHQMIIVAKQEALQEDVYDEEYQKNESALALIYQKLDQFYGTGTSWTNGKDFKKIIDNGLTSLRLFKLRCLGRLNITISQYDELMEYYNEFGIALSNIAQSRISINAKIESVLTKIENKPTTNDETWYRISSVKIAVPGDQYAVGDVVSFTTDHSDILLFQVKSIQDGSVLRVAPFMDYAIPYEVYGVFDTSAGVGTGEGLVLEIDTKKVTYADSVYFTSEGSYIPQTNRFDENDLFAFRFTNIHNLDMNYEVFIGGKQTTMFYHKHVIDETSPANMCDIIYVNANSVMNLKNASIYTPGENYLQYRIDHADVVDPGAGYEINQEIFVDLNQVLLKMVVTKLLDTPLKQIAEVSYDASAGIIDRVDVTTKDAGVVPDSLNNIDDEFNNGYYDKLPPTGVRKALLKSLPIDEYYFIAKHFDDQDGDRNAAFMHPHAAALIENAPMEGDPDFHWYQGTRYDENVKWNGLVETVPSTDPFIPSEHMVPTDQSFTGEYQEIARHRFHDSERERNTDCTARIDYSLINYAMRDCDLEVYSYNDLPRNKEEWPEGGVGKKIIVLNDETNDHHQMMYMIRTFIADGTFVYDVPEICDLKCTEFHVDWMNIDWLPDKPSDMAMYPSAPWEQTDYRIIKRNIMDGKYPQEVRPIFNHTSYIHDITIDDISVYNWKTKEWEDLHDTHRWDFKPVYDDETKSYGFTLILKEDIYHRKIWVKEINREKVSNAWDGKNLEDVIRYKHEIHEAKIIQAINDDGADIIAVKPNEINRDKVTYIWEIDGAGYVEPEPYEAIVEYSGNDSPYDTYSYNMSIFLNKIPRNQIRNESLKQNAVIDVAASVLREIHTEAINTSIQTGRGLLIRQLFPYQHNERFELNRDQKEMKFQIPQSDVYRNELHLEDVKVFNISAGRYENILDPLMFEVRFKDDQCTDTGIERQWLMKYPIVIDSGEGFRDGPAWAYNKDSKIQVFGEVITKDGKMVQFKPIHCPVYPEHNISAMFDVKQLLTQSNYQCGKVILDIIEEDVPIEGDGYIHNVSNALAVLPDEIVIIPKYDTSPGYEYLVKINKTQRKWQFYQNEFTVSPVFHIDEAVSANCMYAVTSNGRLPMINPSSQKPTIEATMTDDGTDIKYNGLYRRYEKIEIHTTPYPMRSVYTLRKIPVSGYIDLKGKLNKPLNHKYYEFWVNGKLLTDEVTIITPTKLFLHGLTSLRNFEIIEINRDHNEYFADSFLGISMGRGDVPFSSWDYTTYLDEVLEGKLVGDNYTLDEQSYLLYPVWPQVPKSDPNYEQYPPNVDTDPDILVSVSNRDNADIPANAPFDTVVIDPPRIEDVAIVGKRTKFSDFGFIPITDQELIDMMNEEWAEEIEHDPYFMPHNITQSNEWYGITAVLYDEFGQQVHNPAKAAYFIADDSIIRITADNHHARLIKKPIYFDLT